MESETVKKEVPLSPSWLLVSSPRRTLSLLRERRATVSISDPVEKVSGFAEEHGPKPSEVYGFVGSITTVITTVIFLVWAYTPEPWLHYLGITYYPSKSVTGNFFALSVFSYNWITNEPVLGTGSSSLLYSNVGFNDGSLPGFKLHGDSTSNLLEHHVCFFEKDVIPIRPKVRSMELHPFSTGACTLISPGDEYSRERSTFTFSGREQPIEPISDIGINQINDLMFR